MTARNLDLPIHRFSQDMQLVDMVLPAAAFRTVVGTIQPFLLHYVDTSHPVLSAHNSLISRHVAVFNCIGAIILVSTGASYIAATTPLLCGCLYILQMFYLRTSRQLRFLDLEARSPLYTHFLETLKGLITVRAFGWQAAFRQRCLNLLDISQRPYYLLYCIQRWLSLVLGMFVAALAVLLVAFALEFKDTTSRGAIGVSLIAILGFNENLTLLVTSWTSLETSLGAIARLKNFSSSTPSENFKSEAEMPPADWPHKGAIEFQDVASSYG